MPLSALNQQRRPYTWGGYYTVCFLLSCFALAGPAMIFYGFYADHRDKPSLQWPKVSGALVQCQQVFHKDYGRHANSYYDVAVTYIYTVNGRSYTGHRIALWSKDLYCNDGKRSSAFVTAHPGGPTDVYYDPENPERAVLVPGPDIRGDRLLKLGGCLGLIGGIVMVFGLGPQMARIKAEIQSREKRYPHSMVQ